MPWHVETDRADCTGFAVVQDDNGHVMGCHATQDEANAQLAALNAAMPEHRSALPDNYFDTLAKVPNFRSIPMADVEMTDIGHEFRFDGLAAPVGTTADFGPFSEEYERGSFRRYLSAFGDKHNIPFCHEHDPKQLMGTTKSGRVVLEEDVRGLRTRANVVKTELSERVKALVDSGDVGGMSIGMVVGPGNSRVTFRSGRPHRAIHTFKRLLDVSTTFDPAYPTTEAQFRSAAIQLASASPDLLQHVMLGAYPQLHDQGDGDGTDTGDDATHEAVVDDGDGNDSGVIVPEHRSIAARKRALSFMILTTGGIDDNAS